MRGRLVVGLLKVRSWVRKIRSERLNIRGEVHSFGHIDFALVIRSQINGYVIIWSS